jgi:hypothetical protein
LDSGIFVTNFIYFKTRSRPDTGTGFGTSSIIFGQKEVPDGKILAFLLQECQIKIIHIAYVEFLIFLSEASKIISGYIQVGGGVKPGKGEAGCLPKINDFSHIIYST